MTQIHKCYLNWSSGKDISLALYHMQKDKHFQADRLLTSVNAHYNRISMHGLRVELLEQQAEALGIPLTLVLLPEEPTMEDYNRSMNQVVMELKSQGYHHCVFGDIFLDDLRSYREKQLESYRIKGHFPLWKRNTRDVIEEFISLGFKAVVSCIDESKLDKSFVGREVDNAFLFDLPHNVDPCGENGEFHTFCYDGPIFSRPIAFTKGEITHRKYPAPKDKPECNYGFWYCDLLPV